MTESIDVKDTELIKEFMKENYEKLFNIKDHSINSEKLKTYLSYYANDSDKEEIKSIVEKITYISNEMFYEKMKNLCELNNSKKGENDIYILLYTPVVDMTGATGFFVKSNFFASVMAGNLLNVDYVIDMTTDLGKKLSDAKFEEDYILNKLDSLNLYKKTETITESEDSVPVEDPFTGTIIGYKKKKIWNIEHNTFGKSIYIYIADDCSYSGKQLKDLISLFSFPPSIKIRLLIPYVLNQKMFTLFPDRIDNLGIDQIVDNVKIIKKNSYGKSFLYFASKIADSHSLDYDASSILHGVIPYKKDIETLPEAPHQYSILNNCDVINYDKTKFIKCPDREYGKIDHTFRGQSISKFLVGRVKLVNILEHIAFGKDLLSTSEFSGGFFNKKYSKYLHKIAKIIRT